MENRLNLKEIKDLIKRGFTTGDIIKYYKCGRWDIYNFFKSKKVKYKNPNKHYNREDFKEKMRKQANEQFNEGMPQSTRDKLRKINLGKYNLSVNLKISPIFAHLMGALLGDGSISWNSECGRIFFNSIDKILVKEVKKELKFIGLNPSEIFEIKQTNPRCKIQYGVRALSTEFYRFYESFDLYSFIDSLNDYECLEFLRGLYETEGSVSIIHKNSVALTIVCNTENRIIDATKKILHRLNVKYSIVTDKRIYKNGNNCFHVVARGNSEEKIAFLNNLCPVIKRVRVVNGKRVVVRGMKWNQN